MVWALMGSQISIFPWPRGVPIHCSLEKVELNVKEQKKGGRISQVCSSVSALFTDGQAEVEAKLCNSFFQVSSAVTGKAFQTSLR